jgi:hypothetical protein
MVEVYSKMKPDSFTLQLQTVLTAYYKDKVSASCCTKSKVVKGKLEDRTSARCRRCRHTHSSRCRRCPPPTRRTGEQQQHLAGRSLHTCPQPWGQEQGLQGEGWRGLSQ